MWIRTSTRNATKIVRSWKFKNWPPEWVYYQFYKNAPGTKYLCRNGISGSCLWNSDSGRADTGYLAEKLFPFIFIQNHPIFNQFVSWTSWTRRRLFGWKWKFSFEFCQISNDLWAVDWRGCPKYQFSAELEGTRWLKWKWKFCRWSDFDC